MLRLGLMTTTMLCLLSAMGCASSYPPCRPVSVPPLPQSVTDEAKDSSGISDAVQIWLRSVRQSLEEKNKP